MDGRPMMTDAAAVRESQAFDLMVLTLDAGVFYQIRAPFIGTEEDYEARVLRAETAAIGYVVAPDYQNRGLNYIWLIVREDEELWRWSLADAADYDTARERAPWLANVRQIFLEGQTPVEYEANRVPHWISNRVRTNRDNDEQLDGNGE